MDLPRHSYPAKRGPFRLNDHSEWVWWIQDRLRAHGYEITVDGDYGKVTADVVRNFQRRRRLHVDEPGTVGKETWRVLFN